MYAEFPEPISNEESLRLLREFLHQMETMLAVVAEHPRSIIPGRHHENLKAAWGEVRPKFSQAIEALRMPAASNRLPDLQNAGLTGAQLVFKLSIFQHARGELFEYGMPKEGQQRKRRWWERWLDRLKPALKAANVILGSLAKVMPVVEAIKEFKESVESGIELGSAVRK